MADNWIPDTRSRLAKRRAKKPDTIAGQIRALWPEIKAALDDGQSFTSLCGWLNEDAGIAVSTSSLRSYVSRNRRKEAILRKAETESSFRPVVSEFPPRVTGRKGLYRQTQEHGTTTPQQEAERPADPMAGAMRALTRTRRLDIRDVHGDGDPSGKNLI